MALREGTTSGPAHVGGRLCLDFCNSLTGRGSGAAVDLLPGYAELVEWARGGGVLTSEEAARLKRTARRSPTEALAVHERAIALREALHSVFTAAAAGRRLRPAAIEVLNAELARAMARSQVVAADGGYTWLWSEGGRALDSMLWSIARSAADLLTTGDFALVRACAGRNCGRLFVDTSRNRTRRWCDMRTCGNRAKARRHHARTKALPAG